jgi:hypothetical protein
MNAFPDEWYRQDEWAAAAIAAQDIAGTGRSMGRILLGVVVVAAVLVLLPLL